MCAWTFIRGNDVATGLCAWVREVFPVPPPRRPRPRLEQGATINVPRKRLRRREYARVQQLMKTCMSRAAREILDGRPEARTLDVATMAAHWGPFVSQESFPVAAARRTPPSPSLEYMWHPVTCDEVMDVTMANSSAPGIDGITTRRGC